MRATPSTETSCPSDASIAAAGPFSARPPTIGLIATIEPRELDPNVRRLRDRARPFGAVLELEALGTADVLTRASRAGTWRVDAGDEAGDERHPRPDQREQRCHPAAPGRAEERMVGVDEPHDFLPVRC